MIVPTYYRIYYVLYEHNDNTDDRNFYPNTICYQTVQQYCHTGKREALGNYFLHKLFQIRES